MKPRRRRAKETTELSFDSLIDIFMNAFGILMLAAIALAISPRNPASTKPLDGATKQNASEPRISEYTIYLPESYTVDTVPLYVMASNDGLRPVDIQNLSSSLQYFISTKNGSSETLTPLPGKSMSISELSSLLSSVSGHDRHLVFLITAGGVSYYKDLREVSSATGFRSGWEYLDQSSITFSARGRTMNRVQ